MPGQYVRIKNPGNMVAAHMDRAGMRDRILTHPRLRRLMYLGELIDLAPVTPGNPLCLDYQSGDASRNDETLPGLLGPMDLGSWPLLLRPPRLGRRYWPFK